MANSARQHEAELLFHALHDAELDPQPYSGRGMQGKLCISVKNKSAFSVGQALGVAGANPPEPDFDQLGKGIVLYWPCYEWVDAWSDLYEADDDEA